MATYLTAIIIFIIYFIFELIISFFFNYKIFLITQKKFNLASLLGAISTFIYSLLIGFAAYFSLSDGNNNWWIIIVSSLGMGLGNFFAALLVPKFQKKVEEISKKRLSKKEDNLKEKK